MRIDLRYLVELELRQRDKEPTVAEGTRHRSTTTMPSQNTKLANSISRSHRLAVPNERQLVAVGCTLSPVSGSIMQCK